MMDVELRITLLVIGALIIVGLIFADRLKRKNRADSPYKRFSESEDFDLPSMSASHESPSHADLDGLRMDDQAAIDSTDVASDDDENSAVASDVVTESSSQDFESTTEIKIEAVSQTVPDAIDEADESNSEQPLEVESEVEPEIEEDPSLVLSLLVLAPKGEKFRGTQIKMALNEVGFVFGKMDIYHLLDGDETLVSVASVLEPGTFDPNEMGAIKIPGLVVFSQLPAARSGEEVYDTWYRTTKKLKAALSGRLTDMRQQPLSDDYFDKLRSEAEAFAPTDLSSLQENSE
ncbi:MAG: hypothetical protein OQK78_02330 [Gammaproteobacteria bacterium]|nr:hypothetical protein [Gammaproteobacteria bacterium]